MNDQNAFVADRTYAIHVLYILLIELIIKLWYLFSLYFHFFVLLFIAIKHE